MLSKLSHSVQPAAASKTSRQQPARQAACRSVAQPGALFLGLDWGTSGARASLINGVLAGWLCTEHRTQSLRRLHCAEHGRQLAEARQPYVYTADGSSWRQALYSTLGQLPLELKRSVCSVAVDATSSTALLIDR